MWDDPQALDRVSRLILLATLVLTLWVAGRAMLDRAFPFRQVTVEDTRADLRAGLRSAERVEPGSQLQAQKTPQSHSLHDDTLAGVSAAIPKMTGGFFSMNLDSTREEILALPWVRNVDIHRYWPGQLVIRIEEHQPAAAWNDRAMLNTHGEVFEVEPNGQLAMQLPRLYAPEGMEKLVARQFSEFIQVVRPASLKVEQVVVTARQSWRVRLSSPEARNDDATQSATIQSGTLKNVKTQQAARPDIEPEKPSHALFNSMTVELGRERINERLERFARVYPQAVAAVGPLRRVDMRYPNGFAAQPVTKTADHAAPVNKARKA